jgi:hypothetical protein
MFYSTTPDSCLVMLWRVWFHRETPYIHSQFLLDDAFGPHTLIYAKEPIGTMDSPVKDLSKAPLCAFDVLLSMAFASNGRTRDNYCQHFGCAMPLK